MRSTFPGRVPVYSAHYPSLRRLTVLIFDSAQPLGSPRRTKPRAVLANDVGSGDAVCSVLLA